MEHTPEELDILYYTFEHETTFGINISTKRQSGLGINVSA
jgi:hypothetical protein